MNQFAKAMENLKIINKSIDKNIAELHQINKELERFNKKLRGNE